MKERRSNLLDAQNRARGTMREGGNERGRRNGARLGKRIEQHAERIRDVSE